MTAHAPWGGRCSCFVASDVKYSHNKNPFLLLGMLMRQFRWVLAVAFLSFCGAAFSGPAAVSSLTAPAGVADSTDATPSQKFATVSSTGNFALTPPALASQTWTGQIAYGPDNTDTVQSYLGQANGQVHFRLTRSLPELVGNPAARDFMITPYNYGMGIEYPSLLEIWSRDLSVHNNHLGCSDNDTIAYMTDSSCFAAGHLWIGDGDDAGGWFASAYDALDGNGNVDRSKSFTMLAADTYAHTSHGDMLLIVRDAQDSFRFQAGAVDLADNAQTYKSYTVARIDASGEGYFNGGTQVGGADFAEAVRSNPRSNYEPGDVLAIDPKADRQIALARGPYSTLIAGIYSTKPGVLGSSHAPDSAHGQEVPMAVIGIVPCKVTTENGPIARGDLLVASSKPGYAMRGSDRERLSGAVVGKALEGLAHGTGMIEVLVTLR